MDQILVLDKGQIVETGHHKTLIENKSHYYSLMKNYLDF